MTSRIALTALGLVLSSAIAVPASAQSYNAPAGIPAVTAPGGVEGGATLPNLIDARGVEHGFTTRKEVDDALVTGSVRRPSGDVGRHGR